MTKQFLKIFLVQIVIFASFAAAIISKNASGKNYELLMIGIKAFIELKYKSTSTDIDSDITCHEYIELKILIMKLSH